MIIRLFGLFAFLWPKCHRQAAIALSHSCDRIFSISSIISGTNVHNSSKYTTMIHAQLFQCPFNNSKYISCGWYYQCFLEYFHLYKTHLYHWRVCKFATFADFAGPLLAFSLSKSFIFLYLCYSCDICYSVFSASRKMIVSFAIFARFAELFGVLLGLFSF